MTQRNDFTVLPLFSASLAKRVLVGAGFALILMILFVGPVDGKPEWGNLWKIRPLVVITFAGAAGGLFYDLMEHLRYKGGWIKLFSYVLSVIVYIFGLWMGTVLGLNGTLWN